MVIILVILSDKELLGYFIQLSTVSYDPTGHLDRNVEPSRGNSWLLLPDSSYDYHAYKTANNR